MKNISALDDDLRSIGKRLIFLNWQNETRKTLLRFNRNTSNMFKTTENLKEIVACSNIRNGTPTFHDIN